jgi:BASS family bile acid:Na+ symporter
VAARKGLILSTLLAQAVALPALACVLTRLLGLPAHLMAGILLVAMCPVGDISNVYTLLARANVALSVTVNTLSCLLSAATMALTTIAYDGLFHEPFVFAVPTPSLISKLVLMVVLPVLAGMGLRHFKPELVARWARTARGLSLAGVAFLLVYVLVGQRERLGAEWKPTASAAAAFMAVAMILGLSFGRLLKLPARDVMTMGLLFGVRNVALAMAIAITLLDRVDFAVFAATYFVVELPLILCAITLYCSWWGPGDSAPCANVPVETRDSAMYDHKHF